jgi:exosome complex component RRP4
VDVDDGFLRGHGTRVADGRLLATVCGTVERVNKLVSVRPLRTRYVPETGDVVLGRVVDIAGKRWKLDIGGRQDAVLQLGAVHLPGGAQRRRNAVDELNMRSLYKENDLISCEVQSFYADGAVALHTRSLKYGRLADGQLVRVPPTLVKRVKRHFHAIDAANAFGGDDVNAETTMSGNEMSDNKRKREHTGDVEVLLGCNGFVWVGARSAATGELNDDELNARDEDDVKKKNETRPTRRLSRSERARVPRGERRARFVGSVLSHPPTRHRGRLFVLGSVGDIAEGYAVARVPRSNARARD